ncbi:hypothetical protein FJY93_03115 [Candidatus Kaiserbacteria bacterium]|nr:hypothetical protein [Candidatus Kaiserbacteria bacterium]
MKKRLILAAVAATLSVSLAQAKDMLPRFEKLLKDVSSYAEGACPYVASTLDQDLSRVFLLRKDDKVETEFLSMNYYPSVNYLRIAARTAGARFENKCLLGVVVVDAATGELKLSGFSDCPSEAGLPQYRDVYKNANKSANPTGVEFKAAWEQRAEEFLAEAEAMVKLCTPKEQ